jgi:hypothetical protein
VDTISRPANICQRLALVISGLFFVTSASAVPVFVPDNGSGTANVPILWDYVGQTPMQIANGLGGDVININALLETPTVYSNPEQAGGSLGGTKTGGGGGGLFTWQMQGTGAFSGYSRTLNFGVTPGPDALLSFPDANFNATAADFEVHTAPRTLNAPFQSFNTVMFRLFGQNTNPLDNDPDFDLLRVVAGTDFGLPSPGHTNLLQAGPNWQVDSFFDITYRIDFVGKAGGTFGGRSGSTTGTVRFSLGDPIIPEPTSAGLLATAILALAWTLRRR